MVEKVETIFGECNVDKTGVDYQVVAYYTKLDAGDIPKLKEYFGNLGKYEKIVKGAWYLLDSLGIPLHNKKPVLTDQDIIVSAPCSSKERERLFCIDIYIKSRKLSEYEKKYGKERVSLEAKAIAGMIRNIEKYEALKESRNAFKKLKKEDD